MQLMQLIYHLQGCAVGYPHSSKLHLLIKHLNPNKMVEAALAVGGCSGGTGLVGLLLLCCVVAPVCSPTG